MFKERLITALILIPLIIGDILYFSPESLAAILSIFVLIGAWEWAGLCGWQQRIKRAIYTVFMGICLILSYLCLQRLPQTSIYILLVSCCWWLIGLRWVLYYQSGYNKMPQSSFIKSILGIFILIPAWCALFLLHRDYGGDWVVFLLVLIWTADSGAYFVGKRWGRLKLADKISPGKTWEGVIGALVSSSLVAVLYVLLIQSMSFIAFLGFMLLCLFTVMASILGDLLESLFKRQVGLKDSGQLLPGHGGILDRIDSLTSAAPVFLVGIIIFLGSAF